MSTTMHHHHHPYQQQPQSQAHHHITIPAPSAASPSPTPAVLASLLNRARSPSPTWTDDSAASSRIAIHLANGRRRATHDEEESEDEGAGGPGFSRGLAGDASTHLIHSALHDVPAFIDAANALAQTQHGIKDAHGLLNHPPRKQGEINYAASLFNASLRLSNAIKRGATGSSSPLPGKTLMAQVQRMVMADEARSSNDSPRLREALKFLLVLSEAQMAVLQKAQTRRAAADSSQPRPRSPSPSGLPRDANTQSPKARLFRALSNASSTAGSNGSQTTHDATHTTTDSIATVLSSSPQAHRHSLLFSDTASSQTAWNPFKKPSAPVLEASSNTPLHDAQQTITQLLNERRAMQDEIRDFAKAQEVSMRAEREKVQRLEGKLMEWKDSIDRIARSEGKTEYTPGSDVKAERTHEWTQPASSDAKTDVPPSRLLSLPIPLDSISPHTRSRPSFESQVSRQTDMGAYEGSASATGSGSFSPAAASSGNNTPARGFARLPTISRASLREEEDGDEDTTPRMISATAGAEDDDDEEDEEDVPTPALPPSHNASSPSTPSDGDEDEVFADVAEQFDDVTEGQDTFAQDSTSPTRALANLHPSPHRFSQASTLAHDDRRSSHASTQHTGYDFDPYRRHSRASTSITSPSCSSSNHHHKSRAPSTRDRFSLPPQAPQPTSPLPDVPVGVVSGTCSPIVALKGGALQRSASDHGARRAARAEANGATPTPPESNSGLIPVGLGFTHMSTSSSRSEDEDGGVEFGTAPSTLSKSTVRPTSQEVDSDEFTPTATGVPVAIAEEHGEDVRTGSASVRELGDQSARAPAAFDARRIDADIILPDHPESIGGGTPRRGFRGLFRRERDTGKESAPLSRPTSASTSGPSSLLRPQTASSQGHSMASPRARGMTTSSLLSNGQSVDTHDTTTTTTTGHSHMSMLTGSDSLPTSAATSVSDVSLKRREKSSLDAVASPPPSIRSSSSMSSSQRRARRQQQQEHQQQQQQKRRELDLAALGITSPPTADRSRYNRGSRSRILGHTSSLTNLKNPASPAAAAQQVQQHPRSFMVNNKDAGLPPLYRKGNRARTLSSVSHDAVAAPTTRAGSGKTTNGGYGYVNDGRRGYGGTEEEDQEDDGQEGVTEEEEDDDEGAESAEEEDDHQERDETASLPTHTRSPRTSSSLKHRAGTPSSQPHRLAQEQSHVNASRRLKFSRR